MVWMIVSGASQLQQQNPSRFQSLKSSELDDLNRESIEKDLHRTFPDNIHFWSPFDEELNTRVCVKAKIREMKAVLWADALQSPDRGYCQGLNYIVGLVLLVTGDEEKAFWLLQALLSLMLPKYYTKDMLQIRIDMIVMEKLLRKKLPKLANHLEKHGVTLDLICTKWFLCLFVDTLPTETVLRVWDAMFFEGWKVLFRVALALFKSSEKDILALSDFNDIFWKCKDLGKLQYNCHKLMEVSFNEIGQLERKTVEAMRREAKSEIDAKQSEHSMHNKEIR